LNPASFSPWPNCYTNYNIPAPHRNRDARTFYWIVGVFCQFWWPSKWYGVVAVDVCFISITSVNIFKFMCWGWVMNFQLNMLCPNFGSALRLQALCSSMALVPTCSAVQYDHCIHILNYSDPFHFNNLTFIP
jgi:hypothetical protein